MPLFHQLIMIQNKIKIPVCIVNTKVCNSNKRFSLEHRKYSQRGYPGNCLIDTWVRKNFEI